MSHPYEQHVCLDFGEKSLHLSETELTALRLLSEAGGSFIEWTVPEINQKDPFGDVTPGRGVYRKLEKLGLVFFTEEDPFDLPGDPLDGFSFSREIYIDDAGREALKSLCNDLVAINI